VRKAAAGALVSGAAEPAADKSVSDISILIARIVMAEVRFLRDVLP